MRRWRCSPVRVGIEYRQLCTYNFIEKRMFLQYVFKQSALCLFACLISSQQRLTNKAEQQVLLVQSTVVVNRSTRKRSSELGIPRSTMQKHMKQDLGLRGYRPTPVQELSDVDMDRRKEAYTALLQTFDTIPKRGKVIFSDECAIYKSSRARNVICWSKENPHFYDELENNPPHVMIWAALDSRHFFGPFFFDGVVNQLRYLDMLQTWFLPLFRERVIEETCWFQQDGAPAHYAITVRECLNEVFSGRWIGRGSPVLPAPLGWPPRSPDLTTYNNSLWGFIKGIVSQSRYNTTDELKDVVRQAFRQVTPARLRKMSHRTWRRIILCHENDGAQTDLLDI